jgi:hypothetical protein
VCKAVRLERDAYLVRVCRRRALMCLLRDRNQRRAIKLRAEQNFTISPLDRGCYDHNACVFMGRALFLLLAAGFLY